MTSSRTGETRRHLLSAALAALAGLLLAAPAACTGSPGRPPAGFSSPRYTLRVLASSELADMAPILNQAARATGVTVDLKPIIGSLAGAQQVINGTAERNYDVVWFASDNYLNLYPGGLSKLNGTTEIMSSPVILGLRSSAARRLGWNHNPVTWRDIATAAMRHEFTFGMTDPATSNSGLSALVAVATAIAGKGAALQAAEIPGAEPELAGLFHAQALKAPTSGPLTQEYLRDLKHNGGMPPDGLFDYESQLLTIKAEAPRDDPLTLVYPSDGVLEATYPLSILTTAPLAAKNAYQRLARYLTSPPVQQQIMQVTHRRPIAGNLPLSPELAGHQPFELPFPAASGTLRDLIDTYNGTLVRASRTVYVLDTSGSMAGPRIVGLKRALLALTGADTSLAGQFSMFQSREQVTFLPFSTAPGTPVTFNIPATSAGPTLLRMRTYINGLAAGGWTAIYDSLVRAYQIMATQHAANPDMIESIVLLTDGENNTGRKLRDFTAEYRILPPGSPPVYTIALGEAQLSDLAEVASVTGGKPFNAITQPLSALRGIFEEIRGY
jgi:Ca-activated chloride channel family protein